MQACLLQRVFPIVISGRVSSSIGDSTTDLCNTFGTNSKKDHSRHSQDELPPRIQGPTGQIEIYTRLVALEGPVKTIHVHDHAHVSGAK